MRKYSALIFVAVLVAAFAGSLVWGLFSSGTLQKQISRIFNPKVSLSPTPLPPPPRPLNTGKQIFNVSRGSDSRGPAVSQVTFDPLDPKKGTAQTISLKVGNKTPVTSVSVRLTTDHETKSYPLKLTEGTTTYGTWSSSWPIEDTYDYRYQFVFEATDASESSKLDFPLR